MKIEELSELADIKIESIKELVKFGMPIDLYVPSGLTEYITTRIKERS